MGSVRRTVVALLGPLVRELLAYLAPALVEIVRHAFTDMATDGGCPADVRAAFQQRVRDACGFGASGGSGANQGAGAGPDLGVRS
jgi:hypothetical protein